MMSGRVQVVAVGRIRDQHWRAFQDEYIKRIGRYVDFKLAETKDSGHGLPDTVAKKREGEGLLAATDDKLRRYVMSEHGKPISSPNFARFLSQELEMYSGVAFLIGGPMGFSDEVITASDGQIALSAMTFPHEMARVILLEQIYRGFTIIKGEKYHK